MSEILRRLGQKRAAVLALLLVLALYCGLWRPFDITLIEELARAHPAISIPAFLVVYAVSIVALVPTLPMNLAAGFIWGIYLGGLISALGASTGALIAFLAARYLMGQPLAERFNSFSLGWIQREVFGRGWKFVAFLRLNPVIPTGPVNYLLGLTSIRFVPYAVATFGFLLPSSVLVAWIGKEAESVTLSGTQAALWHGLLGVSVAVVLLVGIRFLGKFNFARRKRIDGNDYRAHPQ